MPVGHAVIPFSCPEYGHDLRADVRFAGPALEVVGAGEQQVRRVWASVGSFHVCLGSHPGVFE